MAYITEAQLMKMTYNQLGSLVASGSVSEKRIRSVYSKARQKAIARSKTVSKSEFGEIAEKIEKETFMKVKNLPTTGALLRELADVNRYLESDRSTVKGQKKRRAKYIETAQDHNLNITEENYIDWIRFIQWFKNSKFALSYDSEAEEVQEIFQEGSSPEDWEALFNEYMERSRETIEGR